MFIENKYTKWYFNIVKHYKNIIIDDMLEKHHIIPKSIGGTDNENNIVSLPPRVHFICHWLLTKMTSGKNRHKMTFALHTFFHFNMYRRLNFSSRQYEFHKREFIKACVNRTPHTKKDTYTFKRVETDEIFFGTRSEFRKYSGISPQDVYWLVTHCFNPDDPKKIIKGWGIWIDSIKDYSYNKHRPPMSPNIKRKVTCGHCYKIISIGNYERWHGNNCKTIDPTGHYERTRQVASINVNR